MLTAGFLASHAPGTHEQPVWPFAWRPSLSAFYVPDLRNEVTLALLAVGAAVIIAVIGVVWPKVRWPALVVAAITLALAVPHLDLLFVEAYPTSFFTSPTEFAATAIVHGAKLFAANCVVCHGAEGRGDGPSAKSLPLRPADLTAEHFWAHSDGELFWYISHGFAAPDGPLAMPGFETTLSSEGRWELIDYLRAHNAGESMRTTGKWAHPLPIPQFDIACANGRTLDLDDLRGRVLRIVAVSGDESTVPGGAGRYRYHYGCSSPQAGCRDALGELRRERARDLGCVLDPVRRVGRGTGGRAGIGRSERMAAGSVAAW